MGDIQISIEDYETGENRLRRSKRPDLLRTAPVIDPMASWMPAEQRSSLIGMDPVQRRDALLAMPAELRDMWLDHYGRRYPVAGLALSKEELAAVRLQKHVARGGAAKEERERKRLARAAAAVADIEAKRRNRLRGLRLGSQCGQPQYVTRTYAHEVWLHIAVYTPRSIYKGSVCENLFAHLVDFSDDPKFLGRDLCLRCEEMVP